MLSVNNRSGRGGLGRGFFTKQTKSVKHDKSYHFSTVPYLFSSVFFFFHFNVESGEILASTISPFSGYHNMNSSGAVGDILVLTYISRSQRKHCT